MGLYPLLARAAAIAENENSSFAEALSLAAAARGTPLRRVFADEAEALSHDLGHGGAAEQRAVIDLDNGRIRLEYDHRAGSLRESLDALANHFPTAGANRIQNRLIAFLAEHDGSEELYKTLHNELGLTNQEIEAMGFDLAHRYEPDCDDAYQDIVDYIGCEKDAEASEQWYRQAFAGFLELEQQSHDDKLQYRIGWMLLHGVGTGKDETAAREWFEQASKLDNPHAQYQLARMIFNDPSSTPEQTAQALERLTKAAEAGQDCAQYALGKIYRDGQGVEKDIQKAVALFTLAATKENSFAAFALGKLYLAGDAALPRDPAAALKWLTYAAELGNQFAQYRLGKLLLKGDDGIPKDVITAIRWLTAAAKQENGYAEYALALVYLTGEDAPKDSVKALSLLKRSAGRGNQFAQYRLGKLLLQGEDAPKDVKAAIRWLTAAAEQGNQYAQYALGKLYLLGKEVPKDRSSAIKWFQLAADQGNEYAQYFLKHMDDRLGQPPVAAVISLFHHLANIFQEQNQPPPSGGVRVAVDRKLLRKIKAKKIAQGHKADDHEPEMQL